MAKLTEKKSYRKDGSTIVMGYSIAIPKIESEKNGFNKNTEVSIDFKENKIIIKRK